MIPRSASVLASLSFLVLLSACAKGGGASIDAPVGDAGAMTMTPMGTCGDGTVDTAAGEVCECPMGSTQPCAVTGPDKDCSKLDITQMGPLLCDPALCMYVTSMCMPATGGASGTLAGGTSGTSAGTSAGSGASGTSGGNGG